MHDTTSQGQGGFLQTYSLLTRATIFLYYNTARHRRMQVVREIPRNMVAGSNISLGTPKSAAHRRPVSLGQV